MSAQLSEQKELELVEKVELRIALADSEEKLQASLDLYLAPLLLKLASPYASTRNAVFESLKHVLSRLSSLSAMKLPVKKLIDQAKNPTLPNCDNQALIDNVRLYSSLLASKGVDRIVDVDEKKMLIPDIMNGISAQPLNTAARLFHILCKLLLSWSPPRKGTPEEQKIIEFLQLKDEKDLKFLLDHFTKFFLLMSAKADPQTGTIPRGYSCPGLCATDVSFFTYSAGVSFTKEQHSNFKRAIFKFVTNGFVADDQLLLKFLCVVSTDSSDLSDSALQFLKRLQIPYEDEDFIDYLISLFIGDKEIGRPPVKPALQTKILSILSRSVRATLDREKVSLICSIGLHSSDVKLRIICLTFIRHTAKTNFKSLLPGSTSETADYSTSILSLIRNNLHSEGWPRLQLGPSTPSFATAVQQRKLQYEIIGDILSKDYNSFKDLSYVEFLFDSLSGDLDEFRHSIQEALLSVLGQLHKLPDFSKQKLKAMLKATLGGDAANNDNSLDHEKKKVVLMTARYISVKFINFTFDFDDHEARLMNIWGTLKTNRFDIIEESTKGLHPYWFRMNRSLVSNTNSSQITVPKVVESNVSETKLPSFQNFVQYLLQEIEELKENKDSVLRSTLPVAINFAKQCLISEATYGKSTIIGQDEDWQVRIQNAIDVDERVSDLVSSLLSGVDSKWYIDFLKLVCGEFVENDASGQRIALSKYHDVTLGFTALTFLKFTNSSVLSNLECFLQPLLRYLDGFKTISNGDLELAGQILGIISSSLPPTCSDLAQLIASVKSNTGNSLELSTPFALAYILPRLHLVQKGSMFNNEQLSDLMEVIVNLGNSDTNRRIVLLMYSQILKYGLLLRLDLKKREDFIVRFVQKYEKKLMNDEILTQVYGYLSLYASQFDLSDNFFKDIFATYPSKQIEYLLAAGEALSLVAGGWSSRILLKERDIYGASYAQLELQFKTENSGKVLDQILVACNSTEPAMKKASCIWLLCLTEYLQNNAFLKAKSKDIHLKFMRFLAVNDEFVQDAAARGLSLIYQQGDSDLQEDMVKSLLRSFTDSTKAMALSAGTMSEQTQVFEPDVMNTGDGSISTYKDIMSLASEVGDPSLVYKFMSLAKSSALWSSRRGIAFGLGAILSKSSLEKMLLQDEKTSNKLIPVLYRYKFDPFPSVARSMNDIWNTLITNTSSTVSSYFDVILSALLDGMGNKEWRIREASTVGLLQLLQTQDFEKFSEKLLDLWMMGFRVMDDIKESVREAGTRFVVALAKIFSRSIHSTEGGATERSKMLLDRIVPFLLGLKGIESDAEEVRKFALTTLIDLVKADSKAIRPYSPKLIYEFTLLFSSLEPQVINYLALNSSKYNIDSDLIDIQRKNSVRSSPLFEVIDKLINQADDDMLESLIESAVKAAKSSVGLPSKVAASQVFMLLVRRYALDIKPYSGRLLKVCMTMLEDKNEAVSSVYAASIGYLLKVTSIEKAVKYGKKLVALYFAGTRDNGKKIVGMTIDSILKYSPSQFEDISTIFMPLIFIASNDNDKDNAQLYSKIWSEASRSGSAAVKLYLSEILNLLSGFITSPDFNMRKTCAKTLLAICQSVDRHIADKQIDLLFQLTLNSLQGRTWDGKESLFKALIQLSIFFKEYIVANTTLKAEIDKVVEVEISRSNMKYLKKIVFDYAEYLSETMDLNSSIPIDTYMKIVTAVMNDVDDATSRGSIANPTTEGNEAKRAKPNVAVGEKSSQKNTEKEQFVISILKASVPIYSKGQSSRLFDYIIEHSTNLFSNEKFVYTWKSQVAASEIGMLLLESPVTEVDSTKLFGYWNKVFTVCGKKESILNVKLKLIRFGSTLIKKFPEFRTSVESQLRELSEADPTSRMTHELKNVEI
ncbi:Ecm29p KNAG_0J02890 [Huiozyma naganishii CBS 8797]|uniref:Uncharacterized protein n=1 Tax=Huiozyma naganishii (strain ATCC MYA-139 / BCRC 22969 / CBS 8797 / KCTC 17520 / NBRC 10181 / NCYC 3082 / Yp74L-3) TaxID=1071383 RepID=J7RR89_HUIN7|nr:hypothetical protein KNAG_0J02890 [Kazachstania naganishii CBS 8797]CCK72368.1 hypothetical protein KNAG_0J02890 [Kazachstania naganishii CBS 8797]